MDIAESVRIRRVQLKMTQQDLSRKTGIKQPTISAIEKGVNKPGIDTIILISDALDCTVSDLIGQTRPASRQDPHVMNKFRYCRIMKHLSQKAVASSIGVSCPMVSQWESGSKKPSKENLVKLADLFGVSTDYLLDHEFSEVNGRFTSEEQNLILRFRKLNRAGKDLLLSSADSFLSHAQLRKEKK